MIILRLLKHLVLPFAGGFLAVTLFSAVPQADAQGAPGIVTAKAFRLVDDQGRGRALLYVENGQAHFALADEGANVRIRMTASTKGGSIAVQDARGTKRCSLEHTEGNDRVTQIMRDAQGKDRLITALTREHNMLLTFTGPKDGKWMTLLAGPEQASTLILQDPKSKQNVITFAGRSQASMQISNTAGQAGLLASVLGDGRSVAALSHGGKLRIRAMTLADGKPELAFLNDARNKTWQAGK